MQCHGKAEVFPEHAVLCGYIVLSHWQKQWISPGGKLPREAFILKKITGDFLTIGNLVG